MAKTIYIYNFNLETQLIKIKMSK